MHPRAPFAPELHTPAQSAAALGYRTPPETANEIQDLQRELAAEMAGLARPSFYRMIDRLGIKPKDD